MKDSAAKASPAHGEPGHVHGADEGGLPAGHPPVEPKAAAPAPAASSPSAGAAPAAGGAAGLPAKLAGLGLTARVPEGWVEDPAPRQFRIATVRFPRAGGDAEDGEMSISAAGGGLEQNIERWRGQFQERPDPGAAKKTINGLEVTQVEMEGSYSGMGPMAGGGGAPKPGTKLLGAIVKAPGGDQLVFFKAWGPKATMERWKPSFQEFVASLAPGR
jgi:hypothetical protein